MEKFSEKLDKLTQEAKYIYKNVRNGDKELWHRAFKILQKTVKTIKNWESTRARN